LGHVVPEGEFNTLGLTDSARAVLKGEVSLILRVSADAPRRESGGSSSRGAKAASGKARSDALAASLDDMSRERLTALRAWRAAVAKANNLPAYVVFHDATLAEMARISPQSLGELGSISGVGVKRLEAYGQEILQLLQA